MIRKELVKVFWKRLGNGTFVEHMIELLGRSDLDNIFGKVVTESEDYIIWKEEQENKRQRLEEEEQQQLQEEQREAEEEARKQAEEQARVEERLRELRLQAEEEHRQREAVKKAEEDARLAREHLREMEGSQSVDMLPPAPTLAETVTGVRHQPFWTRPYTQSAYQEMATLAHQRRAR